MSLALDDRRIVTFSPLPGLSRRLSTEFHRLAAAWRRHQQARILLRVDADTRADIGLSSDHVRHGWESFAEEYPGAIAPAECLRRKSDG